MSLFNEPVDRFFVGKLVFGLLFVGSFLKLLLAVLKPVATSRSIEVEAIVGYGLSCLLWYGLFRVIENRRVANAGARNHA